MAKLTLTVLTGQYASVAAHNANNDLIEAALENTLSRDGTSPNTMSASLDMNSNRILNLPSPDSSSEPARLIDIQDAVSVAIAPSQTGNSGKVLTTDGIVASWSSIGTILGATPTAFGLSLLDDANAAAGRTTLGLGSISIQAASAVAITGGTVTGITDLAVADGGTGASTAAAARTALGFSTSLTEAITKQQTRQVFTSGTAATYTTPTGATRINVRMVGGGGGGGAQATNNGAAGVASTWSGGSLSAGGGAAGATGGGAGGLGGTPANGDINIRGGSGSGSASSVAGSQIQGGGGGNSAFGGGGGGGMGTGAGTPIAAGTNSGGGGGGAGGTSTVGGSGGGAGGYVEKLIVGPASTYTYTVGTGGAGGAAGTVAGGDGAAGIIIVDEWYN